mgnify:CR=1 FL=1
MDKIFIVGDNREMTTYNFSLINNDQDASLWKEKDDLLSSFGTGKDNVSAEQTFFTNLDSLYTIEPFAVLQAIAFQPKSLKLFKAYLEQNPDKKKTIINSYNWDERYSTYGSVNAGILMTLKGRLDLLKYCVKEGLFLPWQDHRGKNLLFYTCPITSNNMLLGSGNLSTSEIKKHTDILKFILSTKESAQLISKKDWSGRSAYEIFLENKDLAHQRTGTPQEVKDALEVWNTMWQKKLIVASVGDAYYSKDKKTTKRKI